MEHDFVDWVIERWADVRPELDTSSIAVVGRLLRVASLLERRFELLCREQGLGFWAFSVLTALRRAGSPYRLTPTQLRGAGMVSSAAVTKRIARLEQLGLTERLPDPTDGRGTLVGLTPAGVEVVDRIGEAYLEEERAALAPLDTADQRRLAELLRALLLGLEGPKAVPTSRPAP